MDDINLLPGDFIVRRQRLARLRVWLGVIGILMLVLPASMFTVYRQLRAAERQVTSLEQQRTRLKQYIDQLKVLRDYQQQLRARVQIINALMYRAPLQQIFFDIAALTDDEVWLTRLQLRRTSKTSDARQPPGQHKRSTSFFALGRRATPAIGQAMNPERRGMSLLLQGYTTSNYRLADFMSGLTGLQHLSKISLQVARRGMFQGYEAIEFAIEMRL